MILDKLIRQLLPHDDKFFSLLGESTNNLIMAGDLLKKLSLASSLRQQTNLVDEIKDLEHRGDSITHTIFSELNATFVTPLDREDIHLLTSALDDIMDHIDGSAQRVILYNIRKFPRELVQLCDVLALSIAELQRGVSLLKNLHETSRLQEVLERVNQYENDADVIFDRAVADLFKKEKNPIQLIKLKEMYVGLETATDKCEDAANILEGILIKHA
ncbi:MAG: DUF47 domain-containing protein [Ignavibacteriales bacterium]|nr:DUF47 domain-containing protein [Ignavibacteriales bacterium]